MFPSSSSRNLFPYTDQTDDENPNSKHEEPPSSFLHFPSPFPDYDDLLVDHLLSHTAQSDESDINVATNVNNETTSNGAAEQTLEEVVPKKRSINGARKQNPRKRTGKKDRHSKIYTAQGLRDRRMRLSLQIARKFFDLQDMLGFDKASKTIEWLFTKSKAAIKELTGNLPKIKLSGSGGGGKNVSSTSECKFVVSEIGNNGDQKGESLVGVPREKKKRKSRNAAFDPLAKESREKARARARERTREKMMIRSLEKSKESSETNPNNLEQLGSSRSPFETGEEMNSSLEVVAQVEEPSTHSLEHQLATIGIIEKSLGMTSTSILPSIFNYSCNVAVSGGIISNNDFPGFPGDWDMDKARIHCNYCPMTNIDPLTGNVQEQNPSSSFMTTSNICLQSQFLGNQLSCNPLDTNNNQSLY